MTAREHDVEEDEPPDWLFEGDPDAPPVRVREPVRHPLGWPGWVQLCLTLIASFLALWSAAIPGGGYGPGFFALLFGLGAGLWWLARIEAAVVALVRRRAVPPTRSLLVRWLLAPALVGIVAVLVWQDVPVRTTFALSRGSFDAILSEPLPTEPTDPYFAAPRDLGLYSGYVHAEGNALLVDVATLGGEGFAHLDGPLPPGIELGLSLGGGWYVFEQPSLYPD